MNNQTDQNISINIKNKTTATDLPIIDNQSKPPIFSFNTGKKYFLCGIIISVVLTIGGVSYLFYLRSYNSNNEKEKTGIQSTPTAIPTEFSNTPTPKITLVPTQIISTFNATNPIAIDTFYLHAGGSLKRTREGYILTEDLSAITFEESEREYFENIAQKYRDKKTIYAVETEASDGQKLIYYTNVGYAAPSSDIVELIDNKEIPVNSTASFNSALIAMNPAIQKINYYINDVLIKSVSRKSNGPKVMELNKKPTTERSQIGNKPVEVNFAIELSWEIETDDEDHTWILLQYVQPSGKLSTTIPGLTYKQAKSITINPKTIFYYTQIDFNSLGIKLTVTDGFYTSVWEEKEFIQLQEKE